MGRDSLMGRDPLSRENRLAGVGATASAPVCLAGRGVSDPRGCPGASGGAHWRPATTSVSVSPLSRA